jgi:hypothetical protein
MNIAGDSLLTHKKYCCPPWSTARERRGSARPEIMVSQLIPILESMWEIAILYEVATKTAVSKNTNVNPAADT